MYCLDHGLVQKKQRAARIDDVVLANSTMASSDDDVAGEDDHVDEEIGAVKEEVNLDLEEHLCVAPPIPCLEDFDESQHVRDELGEDRY